MGFLADRRILVTGVLSSRSIAYGVARACQREGATLAFTYVNDDLKRKDPLKLTPGDKIASIELLEL